MTGFRKCVFTTDTPDTDYDGHTNTKNIERNNKETVRILIIL